MMWPFRRNSHADTLRRLEDELLAAHEKLETYLQLQTPQLFWNPTLCVRRFPDGSVKQWGILAPHDGLSVARDVDPDTFILPYGMSSEWRELDLQLERT